MDTTVIDISSLNEFLNFSIVLTCFIVGYVIKNYTKINNKYIPLIMMILGMILNVAFVIGGQGTVTFNTIIVGIISGLASTGSYEMIVNTFNLKESKDEDNKTE